MNLTVAVKIIGGFAIVLVFLIITCGISLLSLSTIQDSTNKQSELAIPTLMISSELNNKLALVGNVIILSYYQTDISQLIKQRKEFELTQSNFESVLDKLKSVVQKEPE